SAIAARRRGATWKWRSPEPIPAFASASSSRPGSWASAWRQAAAGSSSQPISTSRSGNGLGLLDLEVGARDRLGQPAHAQDVVGPVGHGDRPAGVEQVEGVRALEDAVVGGQRQAGLDAAARLGLEVVEVAGIDLD